MGRNGEDAASSIMCAFNFRIRTSTWGKKHTISGSAISAPTLLEMFYESHCKNWLAAVGLNFLQKVNPVRESLCTTLNFLFCFFPFLCCIYLPSHTMHKIFSIHNFPSYSQIKGAAILLYLVRASFIFLLFVVVVASEQPAKIKISCRIFVLPHAQNCLLWKSAIKCPLKQPAYRIVKDEFIHLPIQPECNCPTVWRVTLQQTLLPPRNDKTFWIESVKSQTFVPNY